MLSEVEAEAGHAADPGEQILHHILDANVIKIPFSDKVIPLPTIHLPESFPLLGGADFSITKHVVMMWIACAILLFLFGRAAHLAPLELHLSVSERHEEPLVRHEQFPQLFELIFLDPYNRLHRITPGGRACCLLLLGAQNTSYSVIPAKARIQFEDVKHLMLPLLFTDN